MAERQPLNVCLRTAISRSKQKNPFKASRISADVPDSLLSEECARGQTERQEGKKAILRPCCQYVAMA
jgi:hypothetical protein